MKKKDLLEQLEKVGMDDEIAVDATALKARLHDRDIGEVIGQVKSVEIVQTVSPHARLVVF